MKIELTKDEVQLALNELPGNSPIYVTLKAKLDLANHTADLVRREWDTYCSHYWLTSADFGKLFVFRGCSYRVTGINPSAPRFPVLATRLPDGKEFRFHASAVK